jgi:hypothetical protein
MNSVPQLSTMRPQLVQDQRPNYDLARRCGSMAEAAYRFLSNVLGAMANWR